MNSRERVLAAIDHRQPDRVPIDLGATRQSGIAASAYHQLKQRLGISTPTRVFDVYQMLAEVEAPVLDRFGVDVVGIQRPVVAFGIRNDTWREWTMFDGTPVQVPDGYQPEEQPGGDLLLRDAEGKPLAKMPKGGFYYDRVDTAPGAAHLAPEELSFPTLSQEECDHLHAQAEAYRQTSDRAVIVAMGPPQELFFGMGIGNFPQWMMTLATEPDYVRSLYERLVEIWLENLRLLNDAVGDAVDIIQFNDDLGMQEGPFLSPAMFRDVVMPYYKRGLDWIHEHTDKKVFMHNCGSIRAFIPSLIEMGVDCLNPVQISAKGMDPAELKAEFGDRITFWGGACDSQKTLPFGTPDEVAAEVEANLATFGAGGGYVAAAVHNIQAGVPIDNILALFDTALTGAR